MSKYALLEETNNLGIHHRAYSRGTAPTGRSSLRVHDRIGVVLHGTRRDPLDDLQLIGTFQI
jgi:hypothetical protein